jgi:hypothetical protein
MLKLGGIRAGDTGHFRGLAIVLFDPALMQGTSSATISRSWPTWPTCQCEVGHLRRSAAPIFCFPYDAPAWNFLRDIPSKVAKFRRCPREVGHLGISCSPFPPPFPGPTRRQPGSCSNVGMPTSRVAATGCSQGRESLDPISLNSRLPAPAGAKERCTACRPCRD